MKGFRVEHAGGFDSIQVARRRLCAAGLALLALALPACRQQPTLALREGDLLFQDLDGGALADAIESVTQGCHGGRFSHVGIVARDEERHLAVLEASRQVRLTPLADFLKRSHDEAGRPKVVVGRLMPPHARHIPAALARGRGLLGAPYDRLFLLDNGSYYCSELVYEVFRDEQGQPLFSVEPMTFCPGGSSEPLAVWRDYYARQGAAIPEGQLGCNPGGLSRSAVLQIVGAYGRPDGWDERTYRRLARAVIADP